MKKCPYCASALQKAVFVCRYCGRDVPQGASHLPDEIPSGWEETVKTMRETWEAGLDTTLTTAHFARLKSGSQSQKTHKLA